MRKAGPSPRIALFPKFSLILSNYPLKSHLCAADTKNIGRDNLSKSDGAQRAKGPDVQAHRLFFPQTGNSRLMGLRGLFR